MLSLRLVTREAGEAASLLVDEAFVGGAVSDDEVWKVSNKAEDAESGSWKLSRCIISN